VNPVWNEKFTLAINNPESEHLSVTVWNWQEVSKNNFLGEVTIPVADVLRVEELLRLNAENENEFDTFDDHSSDNNNGERRRRGSGFKYRFDAPAGGDGRRRRVIELPSSGKSSPTSSRNSSSINNNNGSSSSDGGNDEGESNSNRKSPPVSSSTRDNDEDNSYNRPLFDGTRAYTNNRGTTTIVKWYKLQKRTERSNVQGSIALTMSLEKFTFSESLRHNRIINILPTIVSSGHILIQSDNAHSSAKRGRSEVLINGKVVGHHGAQGKSSSC
jgi:hypothetical protein